LTDIKLQPFSAGKSTWFTDGVKNQLLTVKAGADFGQEYGRKLREDYSDYLLYSSPKFCLLRILSEILDSGF